MGRGRLTRGGKTGHRGGRGLSYIQTLFVLLVACVVVSTALTYYLASNQGQEAGSVAEWNRAVRGGGGGMRGKAQSVMLSQRSVEHTSGSNATAGAEALHGEHPAVARIESSHGQGEGGAGTRSKGRGGEGAGETSAQISLPEIWVEASRKVQTDAAAAEAEAEVFRIAGRVPSYDADHDLIYLCQRQGMGSRVVASMLSEPALGLAVLPGCASMQKSNPQALKPAGGNSSVGEGKKMCMGTLPAASIVQGLGASLTGGKRWVAGGAVEHRSGPFMCLRE